MFENCKKESVGVPSFRTNNENVAESWPYRHETIHGWNNKDIIKYKDLLDLVSLV